MEKSIVDLAKAIAELTKTSTALKMTVEEMTLSVTTLSGWKPEVEMMSAGISKEMRELRQQISQIAVNPVLKVRPCELSGLMPSSTAPRSAALPLPPPTLLAGTKKV